MQPGDTITIPLRLGAGGNDRKHWRAADRQKKAEKAAVGWMLAGKQKPPVPLLVTITRIAPSGGLDDDNLVSSCKYVRDTVARWLGVDDALHELVAYQCKQERGPWSVRIQFEWRP